MYTLSLTIVREKKIFTPITNHVGTWHLVETESITQAKQNTGKWHRIFCAMMPPSALQNYHCHFFFSLN